MHNKYPNEGMSLIVKTITRFTVWLIFLFGLYIFIHGHLSPGGGFAGGVIMALSYVHLTLAFGKNYVNERMKIATMHNLEALGGILFIVIGLIGLYSLGHFLQNFMGKGTLYHIISAGYIPVFNLIICVKVGMGLYLVFYYLASYQRKEG
ncbi:MAG: MnhB domain-containing protein [Candidatus Cloacimonadota bacterium]|nr:MnhB domain-containing protein [Candidatus Cloacimonadota bacterium]